ncbi:Gfo/Idh/MocA family protein [Motilimonas eburnea]|uniref:Gfo/Idh/MocA family protein n=1 Tax=Motilimonas eburnea TaxID=1737488 RepID=UPI001E5F0529|nr:Gfo/Idh/MocA family oxidoreductase [Motilimonas eburnea]MCE2569887.1 Gfo/Idh/MocA family oxidoreductase [Motilimonas eburnea]
MPRFNWGIIATGNIATQFANGIAQVQDANLMAVYSRTLSSAEAFAKQHNASHYYDDLAQMLAEPSLDIVYIASPHPFHYSQAKASILAGKAVLCEKPICLNRQQADELFALAKKHQVMLMEAMMIPQFPAFSTLQKLIADGELGQLKGIQASMGFAAEQDWQNRVFNPDLGGGALLDIGIYPLTFAYLIGGGDITQRHSQVEKAPTGVDLHAQVQLVFKHGLMANLDFSIGHYIPCQARVMGDKAMAEIDNFSFAPSAIKVIDKSGHLLKTLPCPYQGSAYELEVRHMQACLAQGLTMSPLVPAKLSLSVLGLMDQLRQDWQLNYPNEA